MTETPNDNAPLIESVDPENTEVEAVPAFSQGAEFSLIDTFQQELHELADTKEVFIPVKGYERTGLQVRYGMPAHGKQISDVATKATREFKDAYSRNLYSAIDTMILLCEGLYVQPPGVENLTELDPREEGAPCQFDETLAEMMGMNGSSNSARNVVKRLFGNNELAILAHAEKLSRWLANTKADLDAEIWQLGE